MYKNETKHIKYLAKCQRESAINRGRSVYSPFSMSFELKQVGQNKDIMSKSEDKLLGNINKVAPFSSHPLAEDCLYIS